MTAILLVSGFNGFGLHTLLSIVKLSRVFIKISSSFPSQKSIRGHSRVFPKWMRSEPP